MFWDRVLRLLFFFLYAVPTYWYNAVEITSARVTVVGMRLVQEPAATRYDWISNLLLRKHDLRSGRCSKKANRNHRTIFLQVQFLRTVKDENSSQSLESVRMRL